MMGSLALIWNATNWSAVAAGAAGLLLVVLLWAYRGAGGGMVSRGARAMAATLKIVAIGLLAVCLLEPLFAGQRIRPGANVFAILADNSQSMTLKDQGQNRTRGQVFQSLSGADATWLSAIGRDFNLRQFSFDSQLRPTDRIAALSFDGRASKESAALQQILRRYEGQPLAGVLLFTDGCATDREALAKVLAQATGGGATGFHLPPIYPVLLGGTPAPDISVENVTVTQTNFEDAPVTLAAQILTSGYQGRTISAQLLDESGKPVETQQARVDNDGTPLLLRYRVKPEHPGVSFYTVRVAAEGQFSQIDHPESSPEATIVNNTRLAVVDRGAGPFKVLYVTGRMNPEFKFLQRSLSSDSQIQLTGLIRVAKREPKFNFIGKGTANPLFNGFDPQAAETADQFDQPIIMRLTENGDKIEPHAAFPQTAEELDSYHAVILDAVESEFFTPAQMQLLKEFVRQRGGGLLMLGAQEDFKNGKYDRTPIGDVLPVYCDEAPAFPEGATFRLALTREGWLEPFMRLRSDESTEQQRINSLPNFLTLNAIRGIKPGATVLARAMTDQGLPVPAMVEQRFGRGRSAALLIGDLWHWQMRRASAADNDFEKAWRQMIRWLIADVPQRLEASAVPSSNAEDAPGTMRLAVKVRDAIYAPQDNATVMVKVYPPDYAPEKHNAVQLRADASLSKPGEYETVYVPRQPGAYRAEVTVTGADGGDLGQTTTGWTSEPAADEFRVLQPDRALLERLAAATGGEMVDARDLDRFVASLPTRKALITEPYTQPAWHQSWVFLMVLALLGAEWALRRWKGLA
jgi:uncharacterized membrane protein